MDKEQRLDIKPQWKERYTARVHSFEGVQAVCCFLLPFMTDSSKMKQMLDALKEVRDWNIKNPLKRRRVMEHGTTSMYNKGKCRCNPCREAMDNYRFKRAMRKW